MSYFRFTEDMRTSSTNILHCLSVLLVANCFPAFGQTDKHSPGFAGLNPAQERALEIVNRQDTFASSPYWPNIQPGFFFRNVRNNILYPARINQGKSTNFCGYAALTHILLKYKPDAYTEMIISLFRTGNTKLYKNHLTPTTRTRRAAGTLKRKGELDILHADQLWFLSLADKFKGYLNMIDKYYDKGDENAIWAATNYAKFNKMLKQFGRFELNAAGSDMVRPMKADFFQFITQQLESGVVLLYINSKYLHPTKYTLFTLRAPTHYVVLYEMYKIDNMIKIKYWDYGLKTEQLITSKRLRKLIFGVTLIKNEKYD